MSKRVVMVTTALILTLLALVMFGDGLVVACAMHQQFPTGACA